MKQIQPIDTVYRAEISDEDKTKIHELLKKKIYPRRNVPCNSNLPNWGCRFVIEGYNIDKNLIYIRMRDAWNEYWNLLETLQAFENGTLYYE